MAESRKETIGGLFRRDPLTGPIPGLLLEAGPMAEALFARGQRWCKANETYGFISSKAFKAITSGFDHPLKYAARLIDVGLWASIGVEGGYGETEAMWERSQTSRAHVEAERDGARLRKQAQRDREKSRRDLQGSGAGETVEKRPGNDQETTEKRLAPDWVDSSSGRAGANSGSKSPKSRRDGVGGHGAKSKEVQSVEVEIESGSGKERSSKSGERDAGARAPVPLEQVEKILAMAAPYLLLAKGQKRVEVDPCLLPYARQAFAHAWVYRSDQSQPISHFTWDFLKAHPIIGPRLRLEEVPSEGPIESVRAPVSHGVTTVRLCNGQADLFEEVAL